MPREYEKPFAGAKWIWLKEESVNQYAQFETSFAAQDSVGVLYISVDSEYVAYLNGEQVGFNQYDDFPFNKAYDALPVKLRAGENILHIDCWHEGTGSYSYLPGPAGVLFAMADAAGNALCCSDENVCARAYAQYRMGPMETISGQLGYAFHYDASCKEAPWEKAVVVAAREHTTLYPRPNEKCVLHAPIDSTIVKQGVWKAQGGQTAGEIVQRAQLDGADGTGYYAIYDLGREEAGLLSLHLSGAAGEKVYIAWGEHMCPGHVMAYIDGRSFATSYVLGEGENHFTHYFRRIGGRYLQVMTSGNVTLHQVTLRPVTYPVNLAGWFASEDALLQKIYDTSVRTLHLCMHEHYEDTPWREQALYAMDSRNQALCGYCCFGDPVFPAGYLRLFQEGIRPDHLFELCAHARERFTIPSFTLSWVLAVRDHYLWTGDEKTARDLYPTVLQVVDGFLRRIHPENSLAAMPGTAEYWNFYEWTDGMDDQAIFGTKPDDKRPVTFDAALNLYLILALQAAVQMASWLHAEGAENYSAHEEKLKQCVRQQLFDPAMGALRTRVGEEHYAEFNQALALLAGVLPDTQADVLRAKLAKKDNGFVTISLSCTLMKYQALLQDKLYQSVVMQDVRDIWGGMLDKGATSFWEVEEGWTAYDLAGSLCHGWSAVPVYVFTTLLLGVTPTAPGFAEWNFAPMEGAQASGVVPVPWGKIRVENGKIVK